MMEQHSSSAELAPETFGAGIPFTLAGGFYRWNLSGSGMQLELHTSVAHRIAYDLKRRPATPSRDDLGGLLLGRAGEAGLRSVRVGSIEACESGTPGSENESEKLH